MALFQPHGSLQLNTNHRNSFHSWCLGKSCIYSAYISLRFQPQHMVYYGGRADKLRLTIPMDTMPHFMHSLRQPSSFILSAIPLDCDFSKSVASLDVYSDHRADAGSIDYLHILHELQE